MKLRKISLLLLALSALPLAAEKVYLKPLSGKVVLDGKLDDKVWQRKADVEEFYPAGPRRALATTVGTKLFLARDSQYIYVAVRCEEPNMDKIKLSAKKLDDPAWKDDGIEIFLVPSLTQKTYVQIVINADGTILDMINRDPGVTQEDRSWNSGALCKTFKGKNFWSLEAAIPFDVLPVDTPAGDWKFHVVRNRAWKKESFSFVKDIYSFHNSEKFFILSGVRIPNLEVTVRSLSFGDVRYGRNCAKVGLKNWSSKKVSARIASKEKKMEILLAPREMKTVLFCWDQPFSKPFCRQELSVSVKKRLLRSQTFEKDLKEVLHNDRNAVYFIQRNKPITITLPINVTPPTLAETQLCWSVADMKGDVMSSGITTPARGAAFLRLYWSFMKPGTYKLSLALLHKGKKTVSETRTLRLIESPFEGI